MSAEVTSSESAGPARVYLDVCCLQRPFDDQRQPRIRLEAEAVQLILARVEAGELVWISSEVVDYEIAQNPNTERALKARLLAAYAVTKVTVGTNEAALNSNCSDSRDSTLCILPAPKAAASTLF